MKIIITLLILLVVIFFVFSYFFVGGYWTTIWSHSSMSDRVGAYYSKNEQQILPTGISINFTSPDNKKTAKVFFPSINFGSKEALSNYVSKGSSKFISSEFYINEGVGEKKLYQTEPGEAISDVAFSSDGSRIYVVIAKTVRYQTGFDSIAWRSWDKDLYSVEINSGQLSKITNLNANFLKIDSVNRKDNGDVISYLFADKKGEVFVK